MEDAPSKPAIYRFGIFRLDSHTGELASNGTKTQLREQPFQLLLALLEKPGELWTREALVRRLWPAGTFVDFDRGLNKAVLSLREALGDSAENPQFIETLPRKGYRFIASVASDQQECSVAPAAPDLDRRTGCARNIGRCVGNKSRRTPRLDDESVGAKFANHCSCCHSSGEPFPRSRTGVFRRRNDRRVDYQPRQDQSVASRLSHFGDALQRKQKNS